MSFCSLCYRMLSRNVNLICSYSRSNLSTATGDACRMFDRIDQSPTVPLYPAKNRQADASFAPRHGMSYSPKYGPNNPAGHPDNLGSVSRPAPNKVWVGANERNAFHPNDASGGAAHSSRSPPQRAIPYGPTHSAPAMSRNGWWAGRHGGDTGNEGGAGGFVQYSHHHAFTTPPVSSGSGRGVPHPEGHKREYTSYDISGARNGWSQQPPHQLAHQASRQASHQSPQWRMDPNNTSTGAAAAAAEAAKRDETHRGSAWGSSSR